ncbi:hypothetical protein V0R48_14355 [Pseudomonas alcaligenes]|uniref:hypothetical protein n=1 Tax=Aquipseudomonas alcaligenes TaxID=43263 RepID=UPI002E7B5DA9|nr:hypothetical protein [Pseudomonas alcaligenes]MEE1950167.1 hypothetical protein [Pseudomonas alcaligenes]
MSGANDLRQLLGSVLSRTLLLQTPHLLYRNGFADGAMAAAMNLIGCFFVAHF